MYSNNDLIGQCLSNNRQICNKHIFFTGGGERRGKRWLFFWMGLAGLGLFFWMGLAGLGITTSF